MADRVLPGMGLRAFWGLGEDEWKDGMDGNLLKLSVVTQGAALEIVSALPGSPSEGDVYILDETAGGDANKVAVYDTAAWVMYAPNPGWLFYNIDAGNFYRFNGTEWVQFNPGLPDTTIDDAGMMLVVNVDGTGYELTDVPSGGGGYREEGRRFRVRTTVAGSGGGSAWGTIAFSDVNGFQIFDGGIIDASSYTPEHQPYMVIDGDSATYWSFDVLDETAVGSWWEINWDNSHIVGYLTVRPGLGQQALAPTGFVLEYYSEIESDWVVLGTYSTAWADDNEQTFDVSLPPVVSGGGGGIEEAPNDGKRYVRRNEAWEEQFVPPFSLGWGFGPAPEATETLFAYIFTEDVNFAADWAGSAATVGTNPTATYTLTVNKNGSPAGSVEIATGGAVTFSGTANFTSGDVLTVTGGADDTVADVAVTFKGTRA